MTKQSGIPGNPALAASQAQVSALGVKSNGRRTQFIATKASTRQSVRQRGEFGLLSALVDDPIYRRYAARHCPEELTAELAQLGFDAAIDVAVCRSVTVLMNRVDPSVERASLIQADLQDLLGRSRREALRAFRLMRHAIARQDPVACATRYTQSPMVVEGEVPTEDVSVGPFAKPNSLQSNQSLGAYLRYLYRIATGQDPEFGILMDGNDSFALTKRRPDLADLVLSETNLKQEIPTITLVNEVLRAGLGGVDLRSSAYPISLPYDHDVTTARTALAQISETHFNDIATRTSALDCKDFSDHVWARDLSGLLGLLGSLDPSWDEGKTLSMVSEDLLPSNGAPSTLLGLYDSSTAAQASRIDQISRIFELDFDGLVQLFGQYTVSQDSGAPVKQRDFATAFIGNDAPIEFDVAERTITSSNAPLEAPVLRSANYLARLHFGTDLPFHDLNMFLALPGASAGSVYTDDTYKSSARVTRAGLRLLASFPLYRDGFDLSPAHYAALVGEICPYRRADQIVENEDAIKGLEQTETSYLATLFGDDAPDLHRILTDGTTSIRDESLSRIVARGLGISALELDELVARLDATFALTSGLDARGLGGLHRVTMLCRMLGWPLLSGLDLIDRLSAELTGETTLKQALFARNVSEPETDILLCALDWLVALSRWMSEVEIAPDDLRYLLTPTVRGEPETVPGDDEWLDGALVAFDPIAIAPEFFQDFVTWIGANGAVVERDTDMWLEGLAQAGTFYSTAGVFCDDLDAATIEEDCRTLLGEAGADLDVPSNAERLQALVRQLDEIRTAQVKMILSRVAALGSAVSVDSAATLLAWVGIKPLKLLLELVTDPHGDATIFWLFEIKRHIAFVAALDLGEGDLWMLGSRPDWLIQGDTAGRNSLAQFYTLQRFQTLQVSPIDDTTWLGYLAMVHNGRPLPDASQEEVDQWVAGNRTAAALLLRCPIEDATLYYDHLFGSEAVAESIADLDLLARYIRLAEELELSARELLALEAVASSEVQGDWSEAAAAATVGLSRHQDGSRLDAYKNALAELERDALVAAFMQSKIAGDERLKSVVTDRETLYSYLLLDVNVTSAVPTSRLVEAASSLQLYISRALAGLEPAASFIGTDGFDRRPALAAQWQLDRDYRRWEASQSLLLYPQNYIEPELRVVRSPAFDTLLQAVSGGEIDPDGVEAAVNAYMSELAEACDLSLCSFYLERHPGKEEIENITYHMVAKAKWEPGRFFYRRLDVDYQTIDALADPSLYQKAMDWTYWQEVTVPDIYPLFSDLTACFFKNRLFFLWLELEKHEKQFSDGERLSGWRIHPRYMRCDQSALAGSMMTPGLFKAGPLSGRESLHIVDGAFETYGQEPKIYSTLHPAKSNAALSYGRMNASSSVEKQPTIAVTFGVTFQDRDKEEDPQETALHIRLTADWADSILEIPAQVPKSFEENAPTGYSAVHSKLVSGFRAIPDQYVKKPELIFEPEMDGVYLSKELDDVNLMKARFPSDATEVRVEFNPSDYTDETLGSLDVTINAFYKQFEFYNPYPEEVSFFYVHGNSPGFVNRLCSVKLEARDHVPQMNTYDLTPLNTNTLKFIERIPPISEKKKNMFIEGAYSAEISLPPDFDYNSEVKVTLKIQFNIEYRERVTLYTDSFEDEDIRDRGDLLSRNKMPLVTLEETFQLQLPQGKNNSAWVDEGQHVARSFLHVMDKPSRPLSETYVLYNTSSALAELAQSAPRPGGCESLFQQRNQVGREDLGTFLNGFPKTLEALYEYDDTSLDPMRLPKRTFDFDGPYGGYGWEVFYHIPTAIAAGYASSGEFDRALRWLHKVFDPQSDKPWRVVPLIDAALPADGPAFDTGELFVDPDKIAQDYPFYYKQATIRSYLEVMLDAGDAAYSEETQESLQRAKALYVSAKQIFDENLPETLEVMTNTPWENPTLGEVSRGEGTPFLPPYNAELSGIYDTLEARLTNLRAWLDMNGEPLVVPLLAEQIDPAELQCSAKGGLSSVQSSAEDEGMQDLPLDFPYMLRSAKGYINNLKLTSQRLQSVSEKESDSQMEELRMNANLAKAERAVDLQDFSVRIAQADVVIKTTNVSISTLAFLNHVKTLLSKAYKLEREVGQFAIDALKSRAVSLKTFVQYTTGEVKANMPTIAGMAVGGASPEQGNSMKMDEQLANFLKIWRERQELKSISDQTSEFQSRTLKTAELLAKLNLDTTELAKASIALRKAKETKKDLVKKKEGAESILTRWSEVFGGTADYTPLREDTEALYVEEWIETQKFLKLLVRVFEEETQSSRAGILSTVFLGRGMERFNAPHRLSLDIQRLELAYIEAMRSQASETAEVTFALSAVPALHRDENALDALLADGQVYFDLTDEMFDVYYPGQYDRRIQSIAVDFPGLARAGLSAHARLTQVSNTRFLSPERHKARGAKIRKDRYPLQSVILGNHHVDTLDIEEPEGLLGRFQNTGVTSRWHLVIPAVRDLKQGKKGNGHTRAWRESATRHHEALKPNLDEVEFKVRFSGRWSGDGPTTSVLH